MQKSALITGGAGFIGLHLARLLSEKCEVTIADNLERGRFDGHLRVLLEKKNVSFVKMDITKERDFSKLDSSDFVYHLAAINGTRNFYEIPDKVLKVGATGTLNVLEWFVKSKSGKILFSSSSEAYAGTKEIMGKRFPIPTPENVPLSISSPENPRWSYGATKILGEVAMHSFRKRHKIDFTIVRYHNIYGPRMGFDHVVPEFIMRALSHENPFRIFGGDSMRSFCHVDDAVLATKLAMENRKADNRTIHVGRDDGEIKIAKLAEKIIALSGYKPRLSVRPAPEGSIMRRCPDISVLKGLGFRPKVGLDAGLGATFNWYKENADY